MTDKVIIKDVHNVDIDFAENGFIVEYSGRTSDDDYHTTKVICNSFDNMVDVLKQAVNVSQYK
jgi:hypothetical protein